MLVISNSSHQMSLFFCRGVTNISQFAYLGILHLLHLLTMCYSGKTQTTNNAVCILISVPIVGTMSVLTYEIRVGCCQFDGASRIITRPLARVAVVLGAWSIPCARNDDKCSSHVCGWLLCVCHENKQCVCVCVISEYVIVRTVALDGFGFVCRLAARWRRYVRRSPTPPAAS